MIILLTTIATIFLLLGVLLVLSIRWPPLMRRTFWLSERIEFWQMVRTLWHQGLGPKEVFEELEVIYSEEGKRRNRGSLLCQQLAGAVSKRTFRELNLPGPQDKVATLEDVLSLWCSPLEAVLFRVGNASGNMSDALTQSVNLLDYVQQMRRIMYPALSKFALVTLSLPGILWGVSEYLLPAMAKLIPQERWTLHATLLNRASGWMQEHGLLLCLLVVVLVAYSVRSIPRRGGVIRRHVLERIPPWSIYSTLQGALFMLSAGALMKAGMRAIEVLETLRAHASPWLVARLDAAAFRVRSGRNLGQALYESGYQFPSTRSAIFLRKAGLNKDIANVIHRWGQDQLPLSLARIRSLSEALTLTFELLIAAFLIYVMFAVVSLTMTLSSRGFS